MSRPTKRKSLYVVAVIAAGGAAAIWFGGPSIASWQRARLAERFLQRIEAGDDRSVPQQIELLGSLGVEAVGPLVEAAASPRSALAQSAQRELSIKLTNWKLRAADDPRFNLAERLTALAAALSREAPSFGPAGQRWVEGLALEMIDAAVDVPAESAASLLADCQRVLDAVPARGERLRSFRSALGAEPPATKPELTPPALPIELLADAQPHRWPNEFFPPTPSPPSPDEHEIPPSDPDSDLPSEWSPSWNRRNEPQPLSSLEVAPGEPPEADGRSPAIPPSARPQNTVTDVPSPAEMEQRRRELQGLTDEELFAKLSGAGFFEIGAARLVLERRGYQRPELELGKKLGSPDESLRLALVDEVWLLPAARARHWLKKLLEDESPKIRLRALSALATTDDPQLYDLTRQLVLEDHDEAVVELAERIMRETKLAR